MGYGGVARNPDIKLIKAILQVTLIASLKFAYIY
jgi:hypothetical protein